MGRCASSSGEPTVHSPPRCGTPASTASFDTSRSREGTAIAALGRTVVAREDWGNGERGVGMQDARP